MPLFHPISRRPCRFLLATVVATGVVMGWSTPARAQDPPRADDPAVKVAIELARTRARLDQAIKGVADAQARLVAAQAALAEADQQILAMKAQIEQLRGELVSRAAQVYKQRGGKLDSVLSIDSTQDLAVGERYTDAAAGDSNRKLDELEVVEAQLQQERARRDQARQSIAEETAILFGLIVDLSAVRARDESLLDRMGAVPIMGDARLTAAQLAGWFRSTRGRARLADGTPIEELAQIYIEEGAAEHVRGDVAFAQSVIETGSFGHTRGNNYSGIGNCDSCGEQGYVFLTPREGVRGQIQLLRSYGDPDSRAANLANPPVPQLFGSDPFRAVAAYDNFSYKGVAPVWNVMGKGNWATDPDYAFKVLEIYARMLSYASTHP